jgi:hypothetical protein
MARTRKETNQSLHSAHAIALENNVKMHLAVAMVRQQQIADNGFIAKDLQQCLNVFPNSPHSDHNAVVLVYKLR